MFGKLNHWKTLALGALIPLGLVATGCSYVKQDDMDVRLSQLQAQMEADRRAEIEAGDARVTEEVNGRLDGIVARLDALQRELASLEEDFDARVAELETALRFDVPVYFGFDDDEVTPEYMAFLDRFAEVVSEYYPGSIVTAEGFTDAVGSQEYNLALGKRRAQAVADYLVQQGGLGSDRVRAVSYGEASDRLVSPQGHGPGQEGWENRRVALVIDHSGS
jgi:peptidoglycan-associated lipoprotein